MSATPPPPADPNIVRKAAFAEAQGWSKSYVSKLASEGRLVLTDDGRVHVAESLLRIAQTTGAPERASDQVVSPQYRNDQDRQRFYDAENSRIDLEERLKKLLTASEVNEAIAGAGVLFRQRLEGWPHRLAPQIAAMAGNEARIRTLLADEVELLLTDVSRRMGQASAAATAAAAGEG